jgi:hypothetical protein
MALDVTPGGSASDSYLSLADALSYAQSDLGLFADAWVAADDPTREKALRRATRDIDRWVGSTTDAYSTTQALAFPRWEDTDDAGLPIIVVPVEQATYEQAKYVLSNAEVIDNAATRRARALTTFTEPNVSGQLAEGLSYGRLAPEAERLLSGEGFEGGAIVGFIDIH